MFVLLNKTIFVLGKYKFFLVKLMFFKKKVFLLSKTHGFLEISWHFHGYPRISMVFAMISLMVNTFFLEK